MEMSREQAFARARTRWPEIGLGYEAFCALLDRHGFADTKLPPCADELFLCGACTEGDEAALRRLESEYFGALGAALTRIERRAEGIAEVLQVLRHKLLTGAEPKLRSYSGRGPLLAWLSVAAGRLALDQRRATQRRREQPIELVGQLLGRDDRPEQTAIYAQYAPAFQAAFVAVMAALPARERNVLRLHFAEQLNIDAIGRIYGVHRATVARWIASSRQQILEQVRTRVRRELKVSSDSSFDSIARVLCDKLEVGISSVLKGQTEGEPLE